MTKPAYAHPRNLISAFVVRYIDSIIPIVVISNSLCNCTGRSESYLVAHLSEDRFSREVSQFISQEN